MTKLRIAPKGELEAKATWTNTEDVYPPMKKRKSRAKVGFIGSRLLRETLSYELDLVPILEGAHLELVEFSNIEFVLVESIYNSQPGDWRMQQLDHPNRQTELAKLIRSVKEIGIPTVFWFTLDSEYCPLYKKFAEIFDYVYSCSLSAQEHFQASNIESNVLLPTFEPALFNPLQEFGKHSTQRQSVASALLNMGTQCDYSQSIASDSLTDALDSGSTANEALASLSGFNLAIYDSAADIWQSKLKIENIDSEAILGSVNWQNMAQILKKSKLYLSFSSSIKSETARQWLKLQAMASRLPVLQIGEIETTDFLSTWTLYIADPNTLSEEINYFNNDWLYAERTAHQAWRFVMSEHRVEKRVDIILRDLFGKTPEQKPKASLIMPTIRKQFVRQAIEQFDNQTYSNRELIIVWNGDKESYKEVEALSLARDDITCTFLPNEQSTGDCINDGINKASGEYVFKFDDDDFYGEHYLADLMLYFEIGDFDIIGKSLAYYKLNEEPFLYRRSLPSAYPLTTFNSRDLNHSKISVSGSTLSGKRSVFLSSPYTRAYRAADSGWYKLANTKNLYGVSADVLNSIFWRRSNGGHTWEWSPENNGSNEECFNLDDFMC